MANYKNFILKHQAIIVLFLLTILVLVTRLPIILSNSFAFTFDHGKDSMAILHMWQTFSPKFIGPWTSIPGFYFGPGWYYLLLPAYVLSGGAPSAAVIVMMLLVLIQVFLAYKYFGKEAAIILAASSSWATFSTSAWNPFPMALISLIILILIKSTASHSRLSEQHAFLLGLMAAFGFHFSTAFAIFYPPLITLSLISHKIKFSLKTIVTSGAGFIMPFLPQIMFELKHNFIEIRSLINYMGSGEADSISLEKVFRIISTAWADFNHAATPEVWMPWPYLPIIIKLVYYVLLLTATYYYLKKIRHKTLRKANLFYFQKDLVWWIGIPLTSYFFLHFNFWYLIGLLPIVVLFVAHLIKQLPSFTKKIALSLFILAALSQQIFFQLEDKEKFVNDRTFLPVKIRALDYIAATANEKPYSSYHYVPDIYDYSYQYLYFWRAIQGSDLPVEFSYKPGEILYVTEKPDLLIKLQSKIPQKEPALIFFIVEKPLVPAYLEEWWSHQEYGQIISQEQISRDLTVYTALPKDKSLSEPVIKP